MRLASTLLTRPVLGPLLAWTVAPHVVRLLFEQPLRDKFGPDRQRLSPDYARRAKEIYTRPAIILAAAREWSHEQDDLAELETALGTIRAPAWVVRAELDAFVPAPVGEAIAAAIPGARLVHLPGVPHGFCESRPEETARLLEEFVAEVDKGAAASGAP